MRAPISERAEIVRDGIGFDWTPVAAIMPSVARRLRGPNGGRMQPHAVQMVVHRAIDELVRAGRVESRVEGPNRFARLVVSRARAEQR